MKKTSPLLCWLIAIAWIQTTGALAEVAYSTLDEAGQYNFNYGNSITGSGRGRYVGCGNQFISSVSGTLTSIELGVTFFVLA